MQELEKILEEIDREEKNALLSIEHTTGYKAGTSNMANTIKDIIRKHMNDGWIPVEERLPKDNIDVLITYADVDDERETGIDITTYGDATFGGNKLDYKEWRNPFPYFKGNYKVIAWRPLPEPYRPERSE